MTASKRNTRTVQTVNGPTGDDVRRIALSRLIPDPANPASRIEPDLVLAELAASIESNGLLEPLIVRPDESNDPADTDSHRFHIIAGHRRWAAMRTLPETWQLEQGGALSIVRHDLAGHEHAGKIAAARLVENLQRLDLDPLDEARAYRSLIDDHGWKQAEIAASIGRNQGHVSKRLRLLNLDPALVSKLTHGSITLEHAVDASRLPKAGQDAVVAELNRGTDASAAVEIARRRTDQAVERGRLIRDLKAAHVPVVDGAEADAGTPNGVPVKTALWWLGAGAHDDCPNRVVWVSPTPTRGDTPAERWLLDYCTAEDPQARHPRAAVDDDAKPQDPDGPPAVVIDDDPGDAEARAVARAAGEARAAFETDLLAGKLPRTSIDHVLGGILLDGIIDAPAAYPGTAAARLRRKAANERELAGNLLVEIPGMSTDEALRWALAARFVVDDQALGDALLEHLTGSRLPDEIVVGARHLRFLIAAGYEATIDEAALLDLPSTLHDLGVAYGLVDQLPAAEPVAGEPDEIDAGIGKALDAEADNLAQAVSDALDEAPADPPATDLEVLPDDLHTWKRDALVELARRRGVETTPKMTKAKILVAIEQAEKRAATEAAAAVARGAAATVRNRRK